MKINTPALLGALRAIGILVLVTILSYLGDATHVAFLGSPWLEGAIATIALAIEHSIEGSTGKALFGAVKTK